jgi:GTPase SAR1 family protein
MKLMHYIESKLPRTRSIQGIDDCRIDTGAPVFKMIAQEAKGKFGPAFQYVRDLIMYGEETVRRCKVMIVGRQAVGKTSLFQTLVPIKAIGKYDWVFSAFSSVQPILQLVGQFLYFFKSGSETLRYTIDSSCTIEYQGLVLVLKSKVPPKAPTFLLCTSASSESSAKGIAPVHHSTDASFHFQIEFKSQSTLMEWHQRLQHWIDNRATEGITTTVATFSGEGSSGREITPITLSFMDFAGQIEFDPSFSLFPLISRIDSMPCIVTSSVAARCFWYVFERFVAFLIQQVLWNMSARPKGDLFFECLVAELRGVGVSLPEPIRTKLKFNAWLQGRTFQAASDLSALEALFPSGPKGKKILKIVIEGDGGKTVSSSSAGSAAKHTIQLRVDDIDSPDRRFFSSRAPLVSDPMFGLDGLRFWLADLKAHLPVVKDSPSISIFIVGTHKDLADGTCESRSADVARIVGAEVGLEHQYVIHEVSCSSDAEFAGIKELRADMLEAINGLPHMEEKAPTILGQVQQTMNEWVKELEQESTDAISCMCSFSCFHF